MALLVSVFIFVASMAAILSVLSNNIERLLWGSVICSLGFGFALVAAGARYFGLIATIIFLVSDVAFYLYLRTIQPQQRSGSSAFTRREKLSFSIILWLAMCSIALFIIDIQPLFEALGISVENKSNLALLESRVWGDYWIVLFVTFSVSILATVGGFFLVRGDNVDG